MDNPILNFFVETTLNQITQVGIYLTQWFHTECIIPNELFTWKIGNFTVTYYEKVSTVIELNQSSPKFAQTLTVSQTEEIIKFPLDTLYKEIVAFEGWRKHYH